MKILFLGFNCWTRETSKVQAFISSNFDLEVDNFMENNFEQYNLTCSSNVHLSPDNLPLIKEEILSNTKTK